MHGMRVHVSQVGRERGREVALPNCLRGHVQAGLLLREVFKAAKANREERSEGERGKEDDGM